PQLTEACLLRGQCQGAPVEALPQVAEKLLGGVFGLETDHAIVTVPHDDAVPPGRPAAPLGGPEVKTIVQGKVRQEWAGWRRDSAHLPGSHRACFTIPLPKRSVIVSHHCAFHHCRQPWSPPGSVWTRAFVIERR